MRTAMAVGALVLLVGLVAVGQFHYAFYYDLSGGQDLEINLINTMPWANDVGIEVHDAYGGLIWDSYGTVDSYATVYVRLGDEIPPGSTYWGVVTVDSEERLVIGLEYFSDDLLISVDTVYSDIPVLDPAEPFWLGTYYTQVGSAETAFIVMNPWASTATCSISAYDSDGNWLETWDFILGPYEAEYVWLGDYIASSGMSWGFLDVSMEDVSLILALEYTGRGCSGLEIDNVTEYYF